MNANPLARHFLKLLRYLPIMVLPAGLILGMASTCAAQAATFTVTKTADTDDGACDADCSLREAIRSANAAPGQDTIHLPAGEYILTISGANEDLAAAGDLDITDDLTILGAGAGRTVISSGVPDRVLDITGEFSVAISGVTIQNGQAVTSGGGIRSKGNLNLAASTIVSNTVTTFGGGIEAMIGNTVLSHVTIAYNSATGVGALGGGIYNFGAPLTVTNSTLSGNRAGGSGGGLYNYGGPVDLNNVTITNNTADSNNDGNGDGGGIGDLPYWVSIRIKNTLVAGNTDLSGGAPDCSAAAGLNAQGYNLIQDTSGCIITGDATGHITGVDAGLGPLQDNGGSTPTHALLPGSPAFDAGSPANPGGGGNACAPDDQRDTPRPWNLACDIGAYEAMPSVQFVRRAYAVAESAGAATIDATLHTPVVLTTNVTANYLTSEYTALAGSDYLTATGTLTFTPGVTTTTVTAPVLDDSVVEAAETFTLTLSAPKNARLGAPDSATITIIDDDGAHVFLPVINQ